MAPPYERPRSWELPDAWRGYLADALAPMGGRPRYVCTGFLWWVWHLRSATGFEVLLLPVIVVAASVALGHAGRESRSVIVPAAMHSVVILLTASGRPAQSMVVAAGVVPVGWLLLGMVWRTAANPTVQLQGERRCGDMLE